MLHRLLVLLSVALAALTVMDGAEAAAQKKGTAAPAKVKPIYEAPMRVVIVQGDSKLCGNACPQWIAAEGEITAASPALFAKVFKRLGDRKLPVLIRSPGGSLENAMKIGRMIRSRGLDVAVAWTVFSGCAPDKKGCKLPPAQDGVYRGLPMGTNAFCNSACNFVLAAGKRRIVPTGSFVGVHQARTVWTREVVTYREHYKIVNGKKKVIDRKVVSRKPAKSKVTYGYDKRLRATLTAYYKEMGVDVGLIDEAQKASFNAINYLSASDLKHLRLQTSDIVLPAVVGKASCMAKPVPSHCVSAAASP